MNGHQSENIKALESVPTKMDMLGIRLLEVARMGTRDEDTALVRLKIGSGQNIPLHTHENELIYVLKGQLQVFLAEVAPTWQTLEQGQSVVIAAGVKHAVRNTSNKSADVLAVISVRLARFFNDVSTPANAGKPRAPTTADVELFVRKALEYNYWLASPEESASVTG